MSDPAAIRRLVGTLARLDSPHDGERAAAALLASRQMRNLGLDWDTLLRGPPRAAAPPAGWRRLLRHCQAHAHELTPWEKAFVNRLGSFAKLSPRQADVLNRIAARVGSGAD